MFGDEYFIRGCTLIEHYCVVEHGRRLVGYPWKGTVPLPIEDLSLWMAVQGHEHMEKS